MTTFERAFIWLGQENGRPSGTKAQGFSHAPHLNQTALGIDLAGIIIVTGTGTETLTVGTTLVANAHVGSQLRLGTALAPLAGYATITANGVSTMTVTWVTAATPATVVGYLVKRKSTTPDDDVDLYPQVRVLVPFQPEGPDVATNTVAFPADADLAGSPGPGFVIPSTITKFEDWGLFLDFSFLEGISSFGISEATDSRTVPAAHAVSAVGATSITHGGVIPAGLLDGGFLRVVDAGTAGSPVAWARITTNDGAGVINFTAFEKGVTPVGAVGSITFEAWIPHYSNSPHAYTPSVGFRYPTNDMMPAAFGDGRIKNLPRGITTSSYGDRFGPMLEFGYRMSEKLGKRVNIVYLAVNNTTLLARTVPNTVDSFLGTLGWWDHLVHSDWAVSKTGGLVDRAEKMIKTMAPAALLAESSTKTLQYMGIVLDMGDGDALIDAGQKEFDENLDEFVTKIRSVVDSASLSPYDASAKIPIVVPLLTEDPFELEPNDTDKLVNAAIREVTATDGFGATIDPKDSEKITGDSTHFNGTGEAKNGALLADAMDPLVDYALSFGSPFTDDDDKDARVVDICNLALSHVGEPSITSLDPLVDTSQQAKLCAQFYPEARDDFLQERQWSFATRRIDLVKAECPPTSWVFAYWVPPEAQTPFAVLPEGASDDFSTQFRGKGVSRWDDEHRGVVTGRYVPEDYTVEADESGNRVLFTNVDNAILRYVTRLADARRYSQQFVNALAYLLASMLAGTIIKGREGTQTAQNLRRLAEFHMGKAAVSDAGHRQERPAHNVPWLSAR